MLTVILTKGDVSGFVKRVEALPLLQDEWLRDKIREIARQLKTTEGK